MKLTLFRTFVFTVFVASCFTVAIFGQTAKSGNRTDIDIVVVDQPDCPMRLVPSPTAAAPTLLTLSNASDRSIRAFALVTESPTFHGIQVHTTGIPPGKDNSRFGPAPGTRLYFDYVLFADGTSWGSDTFERSKEIAHFFAAQVAVLERLTQLAGIYSEPKDFLSRLGSLSGFTSYDSVGPPNKVKLDNHVRSAWDTVIGELRRNTRRPKEAGEIADQLEKEKPHPGCSTPGSPEQELNKATAVFSGKAVEQMWLEDYARDGEPAGRRLVIKIKVDRVWKGDVEDEALLYTSQIKISENGSFRSDVSEDFYFKPDGNYLIYASGEPKRLKASPCHRTRPMDDATDDLAELGKGRA